MRRLAILSACLWLTACAEFPSFGPMQPMYAKDAPYPRIEPIDGLILRAMGPLDGARPAAVPLDAVVDPLAARIAALKARAAILRDAPVDDSTRALLSDL